jgi:hypothetical protein
MLIDRDKIEARQRMSDGERAAYWLRRVVQELNVLEEVTGLAQLNPDLRLVDRLARLKRRVINSKRYLMPLIILSRGTL